MQQLGFDDPLVERRFWVTQLVSEGRRASSSTVARVRQLRPMDDLVALLQEDDTETRAVGTAMLWTIWMSEAGAEAEQSVMRGMDLMGKDRLPEAEGLFTHLIHDHPDFAEAYNKRATVRYMSGMPEAAIADCEETLRRNPMHFGAWHGLGRCYEALGAYREAARAYKKALALQPYGDDNRRRLERCRARLKELGEAGI